MTSTLTKSATARPWASSVDTPSASDVVGGVSQIFLAVPIPPSVNDALGNSPKKRVGKKGKKGAQRGRFYLQPARDWLKEALRLVKEQAPGTISGHVVVVTNIERDSLRADIDNRVKMLLDMIVKAGVIEDDRFVTAVAPCWTDRRDSRSLAFVSIISAEAPITLTFQPSSKSGAVGSWTVAPIQEEEGNGL